MTPFEWARMESGMKPSEVAMIMGMSESGYLAMERGDSLAEATDILAFCDIVRKHPLDLYGEPGADIPMHPAIVEALLIMIDGEDYSEDSRAYAENRLMLEMRRGQSILKANKEDIAPLLHSMGFTDSLERKFSSLVPLKRESPDANLEKAISPDDFEEHGGIRNFLEKNLTAYEIILRQLKDQHERTLNELTSRAERTKRVLRIRAGTLYGIDDADNVIASLTDLYAMSFDKKALLARIAKEPYQIGKLTELQRPLEKTPEGREKLKKKMELLLSTFVKHNEISGYIQKNRPERSLRQVEKSFQGFIAWRSSLKTTRLIEWFENMTVLNMVRAQIRDNPQGPSFEP